MFLGNVEFVKYVLEQTKDVIDVNDTDKEQWTPLHFAAFVGSSQIIDLLLNENADMSAMTSRQATPLHLASRNAHYDAVELLITKGYVIFLKMIFYHIIFIF